MDVRLYEAVVGRPGNNGDKLRKPMTKEAVVTSSPPNRERPPYHRHSIGFWWTFVLLTKLLNAKRIERA
ncbi:hypothetical protein IG631_18297 [Alternaria alternata]|nr:hypothetical protein IG631_18297 [Alternaria alternata]